MRGQRPTGPQKCRLAASAVAAAGNGLCPCKPSERTIAEGLGLEGRHMNLLVALVHGAVGALKRGEHSKTAMFGSSRVAHFPSGSLSRAACQCHDQATWLALHHTPAAACTACCC